MTKNKVQSFSPDHCSNPGPLCTLYKCLDIHKKVNGLSLWEDLNYGTIIAGVYLINRHVSWSHVYIVESESQNRII